MGNSGLFSGFIKIDEKTNKTHGFEHFTCNPLRDPHFQKICTKWNQLDHGPKSIFSSFRGPAARKVGPVCFDGQISQPLVMNPTSAHTFLTRISFRVSNRSCAGSLESCAGLQKIAKWAKSDPAQLCPGIHLFAIQRSCRTQSWSRLF